MSEAFNPYHEWLGITDEVLPPNHYRLLGLKPFEDNPQTIAGACERRKAQVRSYRPGLRASQWQSLLDELTAARLCLVNPDTKALYDHQLRSGQFHGPAAGSFKPPAAAPMATLVVPGSQNPAEAISLPAVPLRPQPVQVAAPSPVAVAGATTHGPGVESQYRQPIPRKKTSPLSMVIALVAASSLLLVTLVVLVLRPDDVGPELPLAEAPPPRVAHIDRLQPKPAPQASEPEPNPEPVAVLLPETKPEPEPEPEPVAEPEPDPQVEASPEPELNPVAPAQDAPVQQMSAQDEAAVRKVLAAAWAALADRDSAGARSQLDGAAKVAAGSPLEAEVDRYRSLAEAVENFWAAVREGMKGLETGEELQIQTTRVLVISASEEALSIRVAGRNQKYQIKYLPAGLAVTLSKRWFDLSAPSTKVFIGAFLLVDPVGDREEARRLWEEAVLGGAEIKELLPLLDEHLSAAD